MCKKEEIKLQYESIGYHFHLICRIIILSCFFMIYYRQHQKYYLRVHAAPSIDSFKNTSVRYQLVHNFFLVSWKKTELALNNYFLYSLCTLGLLLAGTKNIWPFGPFTIWWAIWGEFKFATLAVLLGILFPSFPALTVRIWPFCVWDGGEIGVELLTILCPMTFPFLSKTFSILAPAL